MPIYPYQKGGKEHYFYQFEVKDKNGKRKPIKQRGFTTKTAARNAERKARDNWEKGLHVDISTMTVTEYMNDWLKYKQDISPETRHTNEGHIRNHIDPSIGNILFQKVGPEHIKKLVKDMQAKKKTIKDKQDKELAAGTVKKVYNLMKTCYNAALIEEVIAKNPFDMLDKGSKPKDSKPKVDFWSKEEVKEFISNLDHRSRIIYVLAIYTGMRRGEILGLRWKDVDLENRQIRIVQTLKAKKRIKSGGKNSNAERSITFSPFVLSELKKHKARSTQERWSILDKNKENELECEKIRKNYDEYNMVMCQPNGLPMDIGSFSRNWHRLLEKYNMRYIRFHDLRHTCASLLLSTGAHPKVVQELLGHSSIKITLDLYSHMMPNMHKEAVEALDELLK